MRVFGLDEVEVTILKMIMGSTGNQGYGDIGFLVSSMNHFRLPESVYRPKFLKLCERGLITWVNDEEGEKHFKDRKFKITEKGNSLVRDIQIAYGGDYSFYKNFSNDGSNLNKYLGQKVSITNTREDALRARGLMNGKMRAEIAAQRELECKAKKLRFFMS